MGTPNTARLTGLASAGADFWKNDLINPPSSTDFHHNKFLLAFVRQNSGEAVHGERFE